MKYLKECPDVTADELKPKRYPDETERFWQKVEKSNIDKCWEWSGSKDRYGYGTIKWQGRIQSAHRISWSLENNSEIAKGLCVLHKCDNPSCVNPAHLFLGTQADNIHDAISKGRINKKGERHPLSKLTREQAITIKRHIEEAEFDYGDKTAFCKFWASKFNVSWRTVKNILQGNNWTHINI